MTTPKKLEGLAPRRKAAGLTQQELADQLGIERATISMWETGASWPSARLLPLIADLLLCGIDELFVAPGEEGRIATPACGLARNDKDAGRAAEGVGPYGENEEAGRAAEGVGPYGETAGDGEEAEA